MPNSDPIRIQISDKNFEKNEQVKIDFDSQVRGLNGHSCAHEGQINLGDLTLYLTYGLQQGQITMHLTFLYDRPDKVVLLTQYLDGQAAQNASGVYGVYVIRIVHTYIYINRAGQ